MEGLSTGVLFRRVDDLIVKYAHPEARAILCVELVSLANSIDDRVLNSNVSTLNQAYLQDYITFREYVSGLYEEVLYGARERLWN